MSLVRPSGHGASDGPPRPSPVQHPFVRGTRRRSRQAPCACAQWGQVPELFVACITCVALAGIAVLSGRPSGLATALRCPSPLPVKRAGAFQRSGVGVSVVRRGSVLFDQYAVCSVVVCAIALSPCGPFVGTKLLKLTRLLTTTIPSLQIRIPLRGLAALDLPGRR